MCKRFICIITKECIGVCGKMNISNEGRAKSLERRRQTAAKRRVKAIEMFEEGQSIAKIARYFGVSPRTISRDLEVNSEPDNTEA